MVVNKKIVCGVMAAVLVSAPVGALVVLADDLPAVTNGDTVFYDTRYTSIFGDIMIQDIYNTINSVRNGTYNEFPYSTAKAITSAAYQAIQVNKALTEYANASTSKQYTIQDSYSFVAKRKIIYPYKGWEETDYLYCYVDKNNTTFTPQNFGDFNIYPDTFLLVRDTNFNGVQMCSIPISENNIEILLANRGAPFVIRVNAPPNEDFVYYTESGAVAEQFRHGVGWNEAGIKVTNNRYNSIENTNLVTAFTNSQTEYGYYIQNQSALTNMECFFGTGYSYDMSSGLLSGWQDWYLTSGYVNVNDPQYYNDLIYNTSNNFTGVINPALPPVYIMPDNLPFQSGDTITENNVSNYNDYGITYNNLSGEFELDLDALVAALGAAITPTFEGLFDGVFSLQPSVGADFSVPTADLDLDYNYIQLVTDLINNMQPSTGGGCNWSTPYYPAVVTSAYIPATYPVVPTATYPQHYLEDMGDTLQTGWNLFDALGILGFLVPIVIFCLLWRFTGG